MKKVIIYGLGNGRLQAEKVLAHNCEIVAYTDGVSQIQIFNGKPYVALSELDKTKFDYIIITIANKIARNTAKELLMNQYSIKDNKILIFYECLERLTKTDKIMNGKTIPMEGIILGMSTAECGILSKCLKPCFCNLAISSQDIFYNYEVFNYVIDKYNDKLDLKYLIIDMYDYRWFNYDLSLSKSIDFYICQGGGLRYKLHNLERNINFSDEEKSRIKQMSAYQLRDEDFQLWSFPDYYGDIYPGNRARCIEDREYTVADIHPRLLEPIVREKTIEENKILLEQLLSIAKKVHPNVKIFMLLMPRYFVMNRILDVYHEMWKQDFEKSIRYYEHKYNVKFLNYRDYEPISKNPYFFDDLEHLNYAGATAFTSLLSEKIHQ